MCKRVGCITSLILASTCKRPQFTITYWTGQGALKKTQLYWECCILNPCRNLHLGVGLLMLQFSMWETFLNVLISVMMMKMTMMMMMLWDVNYDHCFITYFPTIICNWCWISTRTFAVMLLASWSVELWKLSIICCSWPIRGSRFSCSRCFMWVSSCWMSTITVNTN